MVSLGNIDAAEAIAGFAGRQARLFDPASPSPSPGDSVHVRAVQDLVLIVDP